MMWSESVQQVASGVQYAMIFLVRDIVRYKYFQAQMGG